VAEALSILLTFPVALYTLPLAVLVAYWAMVVLGALELGGHADVDVGHLDVGGGHDLHLDVGGHDVGHVEVGGHELAHAGDAHHDLDLDGHLVTDVAAFFGFGRAPVIVVLSLFTLGGWVTSLAGLAFLDAGLGLDAGAVSRAGELALSLLAATASSRLGARALAPVFVHERPTRHQHVIGQECVVATGRVDGGFGQADLYTTGSALRVEVRCDDASALRQGDRALVAYFDADRGAYVVEPLHRSGSKGAAVSASP
jgi:hypothetical protein